MSAFNPDARRIIFDYEISAGKTALRVFKHEKDFERLYLIPSKQIEVAMQWRLTLKPEVHNVFEVKPEINNTFGNNVNDKSNKVKRNEKAKQMSTGGSPPFDLKPLPVERIFLPSNSLFGTQSVQGQSSSSVFGNSITSNQTLFGSIPKVASTFSDSTTINGSKISLQISYLSMSESLKESGIDTSIEIIFRNESSVKMFSKRGNFVFTSNNRTFEIFLGTHEFDSFPKEIFVSVEIKILNVNNLPTAYIRDLSSDITDLYEKGKFSDMTLVVDDGEFNVHRGILAVRSPVFQAMFENSMKEGLSSTVVIEDLDKEVLKELLYYIYSGRVKNLKEFGLGLLVASDKYNIPMLKEICEDFLSNNLTLEIACEELILADIHSCQILKPNVTDFIIKNPIGITKTTGWTNIVKSHPYLVGELFEALASRTCSSVPVFNK